jgi:ribonucleoside-diphosphate reductase alpha chain
MTTKRIYSHEEATQETVEYFKGDELAASVFVGKYALRNEKHELLESSPDQAHRRIAKEFARIEKKYPNPLSEDEIYAYFKNFTYIVPQGSPMSAIGNPYQIQSASNCFVIPSPLDSYGGILHTDQEQAQVMKRRGGVGFDISNIRPKGLSTKNAARTTDGIGVFMDRFSNTCREVAQNGRRGALMLSISCHHPEIRTFINIKRDKKRVTGANISIRMSDEFMKAVKHDKQVELRFPVDSKNPSISEMANAREIWNEIIQAAWESAEPGILFWDTVVNNGPADIYEDYKSTSTNPCGEITLSPYDSCRLMVVNLNSFVNNPFTSKAEFDFTKFAEVTQVAQRLMDDMIDIELEQIDKILKKIHDDAEPDNVKKIEVDLWNNIKKACINGRRTGLGITALGDTLAALDIRYGSKESIKMTEEIYKALAVNSEKSSCIMARDRGAFPIFDAKLEKGHPFIERLMDSDPELKSLYKKHGRRNISTTTTAPVGSVSTMTQTTSGIEPSFLLRYTRRKKINPTDKSAVKVDFTDDMGDKWQEFTVYHHGFRKWMEVTGKEKIEDSPYFKATSNEVDWVASVDLQAAAQKWVSHSISKTCNLPNSATRELVSDIYMRAWESGCKGFTIYRDGCRTGVLIEEKPKEVKAKEGRDAITISKTTAPKRPAALKCEVHHVKLSKKLDKVRSIEYCAVVGLFEGGEPYELFVFENGTIDPKYVNGKLVKKAKGHYDVEFEDGYVIKNIMKDQTEEEELVTRLVSISLRHGTPLEHLVHQLEKVRTDNISSFTKVMCRVLKKYIKNGTKVTGETCPGCGSKDIIRMEGCQTCKSCGYSKC